MKIDDVIQVVNQIELEPEKRTELIEKIAELEQVLKAEKSSTREKKSSREFVIVLKSPEDLSKYEIVGTVFSMPEGAEAAMLPDQLRQCAVSHNLAQKKKVQILKNVDDVVSFIKPKFLKEHGLKRAANKEWNQVIQITEPFLSEFPTVE